MNRLYQRWSEIKKCSSVLYFTIHRIRIKRRTRTFYTSPTYTTCIYSNQNGIFYNLSESAFLFSILVENKSIILNEISFEHNYIEI
jgi:hypothetical protein